MMRYVYGLVCVLLLVGVCFADKKGRRWQNNWTNQASQVSQKEQEVGKIGEICENALDEVNKARAERGLKPFIHDPLLNKGALACAKYRAERLISGHCRGQMGDFAFLPPEVDVNGVVGGCAAWESGFGACAMYENYTFCGASWVRGSDGLKYCHIFVR